MSCERAWLHLTALRKCIGTIIVVRKAIDAIIEYSAAERILENHAKKLYVQYNKPIVLTEIGWEAYPGACAHTYGNGPSKGGDRIEQASCYEAIFQAIEDAPYVIGMQAWTWTANKPGDEFPWIWTDSANEVRFSKTEKEFAKWY
ncbi:hypothetical protein HY993_00210 [Candidatus Micrarchaeota archaeon]|nr:hypothetical protein [Candidatus Micrarchaeota archaeon]